MTNEQTTTQLSAVVPERWRPRYIEALYEPHDIVPHVLNATEDFGGVGDICHIAVEGTALTVNDTGSDGSLTVQTQTPTDVTLTVNKEKDVTVEITGKARKQAYDIWENKFPLQAAKAVRQQYQSDIFALFSNITQSAGDGSGNLGEDEYLSAIQTLVTNKLPILEQPDKFCFGLHTSQFGPAKKQNFLDYNRTGESGSGGAASIRLPMLWEIPVVFSTQVNSSSSFRQNLLFAQEAFAIAIQRNVEVKMTDRLAAAKTGWLMSCMALYGVITNDATRAVILKSKA